MLGGGAGRLRGGGGLHSLLERDVLPLLLVALRRSLPPRLSPVPTFLLSHHRIPDKLRKQAIWICPKIKQVVDTMVNHE